jgi:hypothetical protein
MNLSRCLKNEIMSGRHCVILFMTLCRHKKNDIMSARHYFIFLTTQIHNKNDTPSVKSSIQKITDIMSKKSPTLCQPTLIQGATKNKQTALEKKVQVKMTYFLAEFILE